ncbi:DUF7167 family protein [Peribacillus muralis]|uniref:DUF7167 family protein n=1 Tax=Peribacillus muralis TaxID=264697 RepID=UPI003D007661
MDKNTKVYFTLSIGYQGATHDDEFTLDQLGIDPETNEDIESLIEQEWKDWSANYIDGGWSYDKQD